MFSVKNSVGCMYSLCSTFLYMVQYLSILSVVSWLGRGQRIQVKQTFKSKQTETGPHVEFCWKDPSAKNCN